MISIPLDSITLDPDLQPRDEIHEEVLIEYGHRLQEGATFPPVIVFFDGTRNWLADGYHRWHAHKALGLDAIAAEVRQGSKRAAILFSLAANSDHGQQRGAADFRKAYAIACRYDLVDPTSAAQVASTLRCTERWARELTRAAREQADRERDSEIAEQRQQGRSARQIARDLGVDDKTVASAEKRKASENPHRHLSDQQHEVCPTCLRPL